MGHTVTGIDISSESIEKCKELEKAIRISGLLKWECINLVNLKDNALALHKLIQGNV